MARIERLVPGHHGPQDAGILVDHRHGGLLPAVLLAQLMYPPRDWVVALVGAPHHRLSPLNERGAQIRVAPAADAAQVALAAAGILPRRQAHPGAELGPFLNCLKSPAVATTAKGSGLALQ